MANGYKASILFEENYNATAHIIVNQGGTNSGKTFAIVQVLFKLAYEQPKQVITIVGQDIPNIKSGVLRDALSIYSSSKQLLARVKSFNKSERLFKFKNGTGHSFAATSR